MEAQARYLFLSTLSGVAWGLVGAGIGASVFDDMIWGGVIASPLIGLVSGLAARPLIRAPFPGLATLALANLHLAAALFGLAMGTYDWWFVRDIPHRSIEVVFQAVPDVLWGITLSGWIFLLWPLSIANHLLLARGVSAATWH